MSTSIIERMAVEVDGAGDALIMVHGLGGTSNVFTPQMEVLGPRFRVIRPDLPGSGRSPASGALSIQAFVDTLARMARVLGVERAHFIGHSLGAVVCCHFAAQHSSVVRSLALFGPQLAPSEAGRNAMRERAKLARTDGMAPIANAVVEVATSADTRATQPIAVAFIRELLMRQDPEGYARTCEVWAGAEAADLTRIKCRAVLITGDDDAIAPPSVARAMADRMAGARAIVLNRCGHWTNVERAKDVNTALREFYFGRA